MTSSSDRRIVFSDGYGARLLGIDAASAATDHEAAIRVARREVALLRPDLYVLDPNGHAVVAACVDAVGSHTSSWQVPEDLTDHARLATLLAVAVALGTVDTALTLPTPACLARSIAGSLDPDADVDDLVEEVEYALIDCVTAMTSDRGCSALVLRHDARVSGPKEVLDSLRSLRKVLEHRAIPCYLRLDGIDHATQAAEWLRARADVGWPEALVVGTHEDPAVDPRLIDLVPATEFDRRRGIVAVEVRADTRPEDIHGALNHVGR